MSLQSTGRLLEGLKVLDLSQFIPGPYATRMLSDQGAEVIKVEPPQGDPMRSLLFDGDGTPSPVYQTLNRGKRILRLDLKSEHGRQTLFGLVRGADVMLESFRPGVMARLGLDWQAMNAINPALIYCSLTGYGQHGHYRNRAGHDINYFAAAGLYSPAQLKEKPALIFPPIADHTGAMLATSTILSALFARSRDGGGHYLDVSIYESVLAFHYLSNLSATPGDLGLVDYLGGNAACYNIYETADRRFITLGAVEPKFWQIFCESMGAPDWFGRQQESFPQRALITEVQNRFSTHPLEYWNALLTEAGCCYEPVPQDHQVLQHPQTVDRQLVTGNDIRYPAWIDGRPVEAPAPLEQMESTTTPGWLNA